MDIAQQNCCHLFEAFWRGVNQNQRSSEKKIMHECVSLRTIVIHDTAQKTSDNLPFYPLDIHHCSDIVYWWESTINTFNANERKQTKATAWITIFNKDNYYNST